MKKNLQEVQKLVRYIEQVETVRHLYQHLDSQIGRIKGRFNPIMGAISWAATQPNMSFTIMAGTSAKDTHVSTLILDMVEKKWAHKLTFAAGGEEIQLEAIHDQCREFSAFFNAWLYELELLSDEDQEVGIVRFSFEKRAT